MNDKTTNMLSEAGKRIALLRKEKKLKQRELADILYTSEVQISYYETGKRQAPVDILIALAKYFDVSTDYLLCRTNSKKVEYEKLASLTGLSDNAIDVLNMYYKHYNIYDPTYPDEKKDPYDKENIMDAINFLIENMSSNNLINQIAKYMQFPKDISGDDFIDPVITEDPVDTEDSAIEAYELFERDYYIGIPIQPEHYGCEHPIPFSTVLFQFIVDEMRQLFDKKRELPETKEEYIRKINSKVAFRRLQNSQDSQNSQND